MAANAFTKEESGFQLGNLPVLSAALEHANCGAALYSPAGALLFVNAEMSELLDVPEQSTLGHLTAMLDGTGKAFVQAERFLAGKITSLRENCQMRRRNGALFWAELSVARLPGESAGGEEMVQVLVRDIDSEMRHAELINEQNARWETALEAAGQGLWEFDRETDTLTLSSGWKKLRGIPAHEEVPMDRESWLTRVHPDDRERVNTSSDQQGAGDDEFDTLEYRERHRDGHYIWIYSRGRPYVLDDEGKPLKAIGTDTDITRLKEIEAQLAEERSRLRVTLQSISDGVIATDAEGKVLFLNPAAEAMTGWTETDAEARPVVEVFDTLVEDGNSAYANAAMDCLMDGVVQSYKNYSKLRGRDGKSRYIREKAAPIRSHDGEIIGAVMVFEDATHRRAMQMELEHAATHDQLTGLANRVALERRMNDAIQSAAMDDHVHALCIIDLDHFKAVNDGAGHAAGDALLKEIADMISSSCRSADCVARIGGDEFVLVLQDCNLSSARKICQGVVDKISAKDFTWQEQSFEVGASIGISQINKTTQDADELYKQADAACYMAKRNGRNCVVVGG